MTPNFYNTLTPKGLRLSRADAEPGFQVLGATNMDEDTTPDSVQQETHLLHARLDEAQSALSGLSQRIERLQRESDEDPSMARQETTSLQPAHQLRNSAAASRRTLADRASDLESKFHLESQFQEINNFREFVGQAVDLETRLREAERRIDIARSESWELAAQIAALKEAVQKAQRRGDAEADKAHRLGARADELEAKLQEAQKRGDAEADKARELAARANELEAKLQEAQKRGTAEIEKARGLEARADELEAKLQEAQKRGAAETEQARGLEARADALETKLQEAQKSGAAEADKARELAARADTLEAKLQEAQKRGAAETDKARGLEARADTLETKLLQAERGAAVEAVQLLQITAQAAKLAAQLKIASTGVASATPPQAPTEFQPPAPPPITDNDLPDGRQDDGAPAPPTIPALEPTLETGWSKALDYLRRPLSTAYAHLRRLSTTPLENDQRDQLKAAAAALTQGTNAITTLNEFWDEVGPAPTAGRLEPAVVAAVKVWEPALRLHGISLARRQDETLPPVLFHPDGLRMALYQLLRNAYESMPRGGSLTVRLFKSDATGGACVSICDTGAGFSREALARLPAPFTTTKPGHLGLGLAVTRRILNRWGASMEAVNNEKIGATVTLSLTLSQDEPPPMQGEAIS